MMGTKLGQEDQVRHLQRQLQSDMYRDADARHREMLITVKVSMACVPQVHSVDTCGEIYLTVSPIRTCVHVSYVRQVWCQASAGLLRSCMYSLRLQKHCLKFANFMRYFTNKVSKSISLRMFTTVPSHVREHIYRLYYCSRRLPSCTITIWIFFHEFHELLRESHELHVVF